MKKKTRLLSLTLAALTAMAVMAGCTPRNDSDGSSSSGVSSEASSGGTDSSEIVSDISSAASDAGEAVEGVLSGIHTGVKELFGEAYTANMAVEEDQLEERYGVKKEWVKDFIAEMPMMSAHVDQFVAIEAVSDEAAGEVEKALTAYRDKIAGDTMQYPMNLAKVQAARVERFDNYVFMVLLGETNDEAMDMSEEDQLTYYQGENQRVIDLIKEALGK